MTIYASVLAPALARPSFRLLLHLLAPWSRAVLASPPPREAPRAAELRGASGLGARAQEREDHARGACRGARVGGGAVGLRDQGWERSGN